MTTEERVLETVHAANTMFSQLDDDCLIEEWAKARVIELETKRLRELMEAEMERRLRYRGARELYHPDWVMEMVEPTPEYRMDRLETLRELVPPQEWEKAYTPEHTEMVAAKLSMTVVKAWARRFGTEVGRVIEEARIPGAPARLRIKTRR